MKLFIYFFFFTISLVGQEFKHQEYFPFYDNCPDENEFQKCQKEILKNEILSLITPEIEQDILTNFKDNKSVLTVAFVYQKNKPIREDIDIDFSNDNLKEKLKKFLLELKPLTKNDSIDDSLKAKHFEFVFLKSPTDEKLYIANAEKIKEINHKNEFKFGTKPFPKECSKSTDIEKCTNEFVSNHIVKNFKYPNKALNKGIHGKVECSFYINENGDIIVTKLKGPHKLLEDESERILKKLPEFIPGTIKGVPVKFSYNIPISFILE